MARSALIHQYLSELQTYLSRASQMRAEEIVQEIESHIFDMLALCPSQDEAAISAVLSRLGTPRELAAGYLEHLTLGMPPPQGLKPLSRVRRGVSQSLYWLFCCLGYGSAVLLLALALAKLCLPQSVGIWLSEHGNSLVIAFSAAAPQAHALGTGWFLLLTALSGGGLWYLTRRISAVLRLFV